MSRTLTGTIYKFDGTPWPGASVIVKLLTEHPTRPGRYYPRRTWTLTCDENGQIPTNTLDTPVSGAWLYQVQVADNPPQVGLLSGNGDISIDEFTTLAGAAGHEAGTPQNELLNALHAAVTEAENHELLETMNGGLNLTAQPRGYLMQRTAVPAGTTVTIPDGYQMVVAGEFIVDGELIANGDLVIL